MSLVACNQESRDDGGELSGIDGGAMVFADNCSMCHNSDGRAPELSEIKALSPGVRGDRILNHPIAGRVPQRLSAIELAGLIEFLKSDPSDDALSVGPTDPIFRECGACHGGGRGPALSEIMGLSQADVKSRLLEHPVAGQVPQRLTARDLANLVEFLNSD
jgi:mono/diheme cytochrome c family protein